MILPQENQKFNLKDISILSIAQYCGVSVKKLGNNYFANCPFHGIDKTPSLLFYPNTNTWCCFGKCEGKNSHRNGGGSVEFVKQYHKYSYKEAIEWIKKNFSYFEELVEEKKEESKKQRIVPPNFVTYWHSLLGEHREYFRSRGFTDETINREMWGFDGKRYTIPVWDWEPQNSDVLGVRRRKLEGDNGFKYVGLKDMNNPTVWGKWYCRGEKTIFVFAGEFDAALANQDDFPSFSVVNGINAIDSFPKDWPNLWFSDSKFLISIFDKKEESFGARLTHTWNLSKGSMTAKVFHWPIDFEGKDYCEFRKKYSKEDFLLLILKQGFNYG